MRVTYDHTRNETNVTGFIVDVLEAVVKMLPYHLPYVLTPFNGSNDEMVEGVYHKVRLVCLPLPYHLCDLSIYTLNISFDQQIIYKLITCLLFLTFHI